MSLVLSRRIGEAVEIGDNVTVRVLGVQGMTVRLGFDAPKDVPVHRQEVAERIRAEGQHKPLEAARTVAPQYGRP